MNAFLTWFKTNWKSNTIATVSIVYSAQQFTSAVIAWENHQPANWRTAIVSLIVAGVGYAAKDSSTHSVQAEIDASTAANPSIQAAAVAQVKAEPPQGSAK
jgi:hypothetical protein